MHRCGFLSAENLRKFWSSPCDTCDRPLDTGSDFIRISLEYVLPCSVRDACECLVIIAVSVFVLAFRSCL